MPREIKFRAWDEGRKKFHTSPPWVEFQVDLYGVLLAKNIKILMDGEGYQQLEINQWTGLLDKDGVEIYEGDILRRKNKWVATVEWYDKEAMFECTGWNITLDRDHLAETEVIGNIYENKELLNA